MHHSSDGLAFTPIVDAAPAKNDVNNVPNDVKNVTNDVKNVPNDVKNVTKDDIKSISNVDKGVDAAHGKGENFQDKVGRFKRCTELISLLKMN